MVDRSWTRSLILGGGILFMLGVVDPLEGFPLAIAGLLAVYLGERRIRGHYSKPLLVEIIAALVGVTAMLVITFMGGAGGDTGLSIWWLLTVLPYPVAILSGVVTIMLALLEMRRRELESESEATGRAGTGARPGTLG
ncbi:MAG: hypothetical protein PF636_10720 [Actinomycetota bacterium]|nr:hypothetical protein [Actinomycetota bacterium]